MLFNSNPYVLLLVSTFILYNLVPAGFRKYVLIAGSAVFYASWSLPFLLMLYGIITVNYIAGLLIESMPDRKKLILTVSIAFDVAAIGLFKYTNFLIGAFGGAAAFAGFHPALPRCNIILPLGISFYTFQLMSYAADVYRGRIAAKKNFPDFVVYVSFFAHLIAGPIVRCGEFFSQKLYERSKPENVVRGARLILLGMFQKILIADRLSVYADRVFADPGNFDSWQVAAAVYAYTFQIYFDFSGYSLIAIGSALLFGIVFPTNFSGPYLAANVADFWRRWHMTLSRWLRDYLYIGLGGSRGSRLATYRNLFITMFLCGLWHGAAWNFVLWGVYHGVLLFLYNLHREFLLPRIGFFTKRKSLIVHWAGVFITFHLVAAGWIMFRARGMNDQTVVFSKLLNFKGDFLSALSPFCNNETIFVLAAYSFYSLLTHAGADVYAGLNFRRKALACALVALTILKLVPRLETVPFIYFQF
ncbi:MAG: MBOAT family O-acyltransferase [bacterium]